MKDILILSENKHWKAEMALAFSSYTKTHSFKWAFVSKRTDTISELSMRYYDAIVLHSNLPVNHIEIIFKYLASTEYKESPLFFISDRFEDFKVLLNQQNFPQLTLLSLPVETEVIAKEIINKLFPKKTLGVIDTTVKVNLEFLKVFIDSTKYILESFCQFKKVSQGKPYLYNKKAPPEIAILGRIELTSTFFQGEFMIGFTKKAYLKVLSLVLFQENQEINKDNEDFAGEIVNMIYGQAKNILNTSGHDFEKIIPTFQVNPPVLSGKFPIVIVPLETDAGGIELFIEVRKIKN